MNTSINVTNCEIYIGQDAGKKVFNDIKNAKKTLKIVSPYLSSSYVNELVSLHNKNVDVQLITTDKIKDKIKDITVSVNISPIQLMDAEFPDTLGSILNKNKLSFKSIKFEIFIWNVWTW